MVRASLLWQVNYDQITIQKGSYIYGFKNDDDPNTTYGYLVDNDTALDVGSNNSTYYITLDKTGVFRCSPGTFGTVRGIGANISGIPWYTFDDYALIGKVFRQSGLVTGFIVCDDPFWCEFEGSFA
jgi:hypothetical protein